MGRAPDGGGTPDTPGTLPVADGAAATGAGAGTLGVAGGAGGRMTLALDTTALLGRYLTGPHREVVIRAMAEDPSWCASALALAEALPLVDRATENPVDRDRLRRALRDDWERIHVVPVDATCLDRAAELARSQPLRTVDALHLAAADRLPPPVRFVTFDARQIPVALALGFEVVST